jgi:phosphoglycolate phosphatase
VIPDTTAYRRIFGFPIDEYYRRLGFDFEKEDYDTVLAPEWVDLYVAREDTCPLNPGVIETMSSIRERGIPQVMLSASNLPQLKRQLERLGLARAFEEVMGLDNIHARSKAALAVDWMDRNPGARPLFVGDTVHDADVAAAVGADCILFCGGHQHESVLQARNQPLIFALSEVLDFL